LSILHDRLKQIVPAARRERAQLIERFGDRVLSEVSVRQAAGGMRGVRTLICDTSVVDPDKGLIIRGIPVGALSDRLTEEVFYLLLTGELPDTTALEALRRDLDERASVPESVWPVLEAMPAEAHPMAMLSAALLAMENGSVFRERYERGMDRANYWEAALEDCLRVIAVLPEITAAIYRMRYGKGERIARDPKLDWAANLVHMLGSDDDRFRSYMRLATIVQSDHEGGHASALTAHTVGSALSNIYLVLSAGFNALAGPLHGLASQVCAEWVLSAMEKYGGVPTAPQIKEYAQDTLAAGRVIPGYGHAVLRAQDPRYLAILAFGERHCSRSEAFKTVTAMSRIVPGVLMETGKVKNPWPNVDAINGALFHHFGITELPFYTVFFAAALSFGISAQYVLNRALGSPITRPRSVTTAWIEKNTRA
jgi:citrate synthase